MQHKHRSALHTTEQNNKTTGKAQIVDNDGTEQPRKGRRRMDLTLVLSAVSRHGRCAREGGLVMGKSEAMNGLAGWAGERGSCRGGDGVFQERVAACTRGKKRDPIWVRQQAEEAKAGRLVVAQPRRPSCQPCAACAWFGACPWFFVCRLSCGAIVFFFFFFCLPARCKVCVGVSKLPKTDV
jgi:hypothetical protein